ncbi:MAG: hypothetical protein ACP5MD_10160 [Verrucomicrobiia bacterium]
MISPCCLSKDLGADLGQTNFSGVGNVVLSSGSGVFESIGAGYHYLAANSPYRNFGSTNVNSGLAAELKSRTTYPPVTLTGLVTTETRLDPQAARDTDLPHPGSEQLFDKWT